MNKIKITIISFLAVICLTVTACGTKHHETKKANPQDELNVEKAIDSQNEIMVKPTKVITTSSKEVGKDQKVVVITFAINNKSKAAFGIGAGDFVVKAKGKKGTMLGSKENFGQVIASGKAVSGNSYYVVNKKTTSITITYQPTINSDKIKQMKWTISIEK